MINAAQAMMRWLNEHNIKIDDVEILVRTKDDETAERIRFALERDLGGMTHIAGSLTIKDMRDLRIFGIKFDVRAKAKVI